MLDLWNELTPFQKWTAVGSLAALIASILGFQFSDEVIAAWARFLEMIPGG